jgi:hypothetical protein
VEKHEVIVEIRRLTDVNGGVAVGQTRFFAETGIKPHEVLGKLWARWGDALAEAGYSANQWNGPIEEELLLGAYVALSRRLGKLPTKHEVALEKTTNPDFPTGATFRRRLGLHSQLVEKVREYCAATPGNDDVLAMCPTPTDPIQVPPEESDISDAIFGYVYLLKSGGHYKIGRSNDLGRRGYEIRLAQPEPVQEIWSIKTDDPAGIESYWHHRFADRRKGGEWFDLRKRDVDAFKRWRRIY